MKPIIRKKKEDGIEVELEEKIVWLPGHHDDDAYRVFTEHFETKLTPQEQEEVRKELERQDILID